MHALYIYIFFVFSKHSYQALEPSNVNVHMRIKQSVKYIYVLAENNIDMQILHTIKTVRKGLYRQANMQLKKNYLNFSKVWLSVSGDFLRKLTRNYNSERYIVFRLKKKINLCQLGVAIRKYRSIFGEYFEMRIVCFTLL